MHHGGGARAARAHDHQRPVHPHADARRRRRAGRAARGARAGARDAAAGAARAARPARQAQRARPHAAARHAHRRPGCAILIYLPIQSEHTKRTLLSVICKATKFEHEV